MFNLLYNITCVIKVFPQYVINGEEYEFRTRNLPQSEVNDIIQDRHGFIWIATLDGLYRYDGYEYKAYLSDGQLACERTAHDTLFPTAERLEVPRHVVSVLDNAVVTERHAHLQTGIHAHAVLAVAPRCTRIPEGKSRFV